MQASSFFFEPLVCAGPLGALCRGTDSELCLTLHVDRDSFV